MQSLYPNLTSSLSTLTSSYPSTRQLPVPIPVSELTSQLVEIWQRCSVDLNKAEGSSNSSNDVVRGVLELVGRELVIVPITNGELPEPSDDASEEEKNAFQRSLQDRLDVILTLYEVVYESLPGVLSLEPGALFIPLLEELVELVSVETWRELWLYIETRSKRFTKDMPASRGKALPLLRTINAFLRFLPRTPADLVFRGRIHQFASSVISVADKSAINMRGDYGEVKTVWEEEEPAKLEPEGEGEADGDVKMEEDGEKNVSTAEKFASSSKADPDFYSTLWSLQQYFAHPPSLDGPASGDPAQTPFDIFIEKTDFVLPKLFQQTQQEKDMLGKDAGGVIGGQKRKRSLEDEGDGRGGFFYPRYLTGKRLLEHELADPSFRRQILVQYFILFQFLLNLTPATAGKQAFTGGMPRSFVLVSDDEKWVIAKIQAIREELKKMTDGQRFEETVLSIITRERHYAQWKNDGCPEGAFEIPPLDRGSAEEAAQLWKRRLAPPHPYTFKVGSRPLSMLWKNGFKSIDQLKGRQKTTTVEGLDEEVQRIEMDEDDDRAMGKEPPAEELAANKERKASLTWRALRLASQTDLRHFAALAPKRDLHVLVTAVKVSREPKASAIGGEEEKEEEEDVQGLKKNGEEIVAAEKGEGEMIEELKAEQTPVEQEAEITAENTEPAVTGEENKQELGAEEQTEGAVIKEEKNGEPEVKQRNGDISMESAKEEVASVPSPPNGSNEEEAVSDPTRETETISST
ncbi:hypothetical protein IAR55_005046 [Kwoniella newhampshirensis]|uniref:THO complex subunit 1 n=1 Tax=Kwoniella newhampshirensis TaxID=1651941 RepID=A0AAW0YMJ3_9TREE